MENGTSPGMGVQVLRARAVATQAMDIRRKNPKTHPAHVIPLKNDIRVARDKLLAAKRLAPS